MKSWFFNCTFSSLELCNNLSFWKVFQVCMEEGLISCRLFSYYIISHIVQKVAGTLIYDATSPTLKFFQSAIIFKRIYIGFKVLRCMRKQFSYLINVYLKTAKIRKLLVSCVHVMSMVLILNHTFMKLVWSVTDDDILNPFLVLKTSVYVKYNFRLESNITESEGWLDLAYSPLFGPLEMSRAWVERKSLRTSMLWFFSKVEPSRPGKI